MTMVGRPVFIGLLAGDALDKCLLKMRQVTDAPLPTAIGGDAASPIADLLARCARGEARAFRALYNATSPRMYGIALRITRNPSLAADAVHDAMLQVWRNADRYTAERGSAEGWLATLVRYRALDIVRRQSRETTVVDVPEQVDDGPDPLSLMISQSDGAALHACLEGVDPPRRRLVLLAFLDGLTQSEVAERVDQPLGTVKSTIRRVLIGLRSCLENAMRTVSEDTAP